MNQKILRIDVRQLPLVVVLTGPLGQAVEYSLEPAGRKFGASLQKTQASADRRPAEAARRE